MTKRYLEIINIDLPVTSVFSIMNYPKPGIFLNKENNQLFVFDGLTVSMVGPMGVIAKLPITEIDEIKTDPNLLSTSLLKLAAIMQDPTLAKELI